MDLTLNIGLIENLKNNESIVPDFAKEGLKGASCLYRAAMRIGVSCFAQVDLTAPIPAL